MNLIERIAYFQKVWRNTLPHLPTPSSEDAARWCPYPLEAVEVALLRTARRFAPARITGAFDVRQAYRYATATARSISQQTNHQTNTSDPLLGGRCMQQRASGARNTRSFIND